MEFKLTCVEEFRNQRRILITGVGWGFLSVCVCIYILSTKEVSIRILYTLYNVMSYASVYAFKRLNIF